MTHAFYTNNDVKCIYTHKFTSLLENNNVAAEWPSLVHYIKRKRISLLLS